MNKQRKQQLGHAVPFLHAAYRILDMVLDGERDAYDNIPENLQATDRCASIEENIDTLEQLISDLDEIENSINDMIYSV